MPVRFHVRFGSLADISQRISISANRSKRASLTGLANLNLRRQPLNPLEVAEDRPLVEE